MDDPDTSDLAPELWRAVGVNLLAMVIGYPLALAGPDSVIMNSPFGMFWVYVVLVGLYVLFQLLTGGRRRAMLAVSVGALLMIVLLMGLRIA